MFYKVFTDIVNEKDVIYLYLDNNFEISSDLDVVKDNGNLIDNARDYLENARIDYKNKNIYLVLNDVIVGRINKKNIGNDWKHKEFLRFGKRNYSGNSNVNYDANKFVVINKSNGILERMVINEYLIGLVAREMPDIDNSECLKAQVVISRTYIYKNIAMNKRIDEVNRYQLFWDRSYLKLLWKDKYDLYIDKIMSAIRETDKEIIKFDGEAIDCYTHYNDCGNTENSSNILKIAYPYLVSVPSFDHAKLLRYRRVSNSYLSKLLNTVIDENTDISILEKTSGDSVRYIKFGDKVYDGLILAGRLGLVSNNYTVSVNKDYCLFLTRGCGHGLGLSKCGAKVMANMGYDYKKIIQHYYPNTVIEKVI